MKKITGFFMAILPFFVMVLLFISGLVIKNQTHVWVSSVALNTDTLNIQKPDDKVDVEAELTAKIFPVNANNPEILWSSSDTNLVSVSDGDLVCKGYGEAVITATSKENKTIFDTCKVTVWDDKIHSINIKNEFDDSYIGIGQTIKLEAAPCPSTHLKVDPTLLYTSSDEEILSVSPNGEMTGRKEGNATITVSSKYNPAIKRTLDVTVGLGVYLIGLKDESSTTTADCKIDLKSDLQTYPDTSLSKDANNFIFTSSNESIATIDKNGIVNFTRPGSCNFTITYKRNKELTVSKTITSTTSYFKDVSFNRYEYVASLSSFANDRHINAADLNWCIYPLGKDNTNLTISSSNNKVVKVGERKDNFPLEVVGAGDAILKAEIQTGNPDNPVMTDYCLVIIKDDIKDNFIKNKEISIDNCYYYLNNNLIFKDTFFKSQKINWNVSDPSIAYIDENDIIHFKKPGLVRVTAKAGNVQDSFDLTSSALINEIPLSSSNRYVIEVGKKYHFTSLSNYQPQFDESQKSKITITDEEGIIQFIPNVGNNINNLVLVDDEGNKRTINLIITESPLSIKFNENYPVFYTTANTEVNFNQLANPTIIPSTSMQPNGLPYKISYSYDYDDKKVSIDDEIIRFNAKASMSISLSVGSLRNYLTFVIKSTYKEVGKFNLLDGSDIISSGCELVLQSGEEKELVINDLFATQEKSKQVWEQLQIYSINENHICSFFKEDWDISNPQIKFKITGTNYGSDTLVIMSNSYRFFINVKVSPYITDFYLVYNNQLINQNTKTYTNNLKLQVYVSPISALEEDFKVELNGVALEVERDRSIDLKGKLNAGENILLLSSGNEGEKSHIKKEYKFNYSLDITNDSYSIDTCINKEDKSYIYLKSNETQNVSYITFDGLVDETIYNNFTINYKSLGIETLNKYGNMLYLADVVSPSQNTKFENAFTIQYGSLKPKTINIKRQLVSRIVLPKHDNESQYDQAGLQKVRVYGNESYYSHEEGKIKYYKLPIQLYDYKNDLIQDDLKHSKFDKEEAFKELNYSIGQNALVEYKRPDINNQSGYLAITFNSQAFYTPTEIYNDEFAKADNKNVLFSIATPLKDAYARYSFVTVEGNNIYCQDGMMETNTQPLILQINFGKEGTEKDNTPLTNGMIGWFTTIYGNGYTINFNARAAQTKESPRIRALHIFNLNIVGKNNATQTNVEHCIQIREIDDEKPDPVKLLAYNNISNWSKGVTFHTSSDELYIKNCLFYDNILYSFLSSKSGKPTYFENCVFFNSSSFAIVATNWAKINFKGFIDFYNFRGQEMFDDVEGFKLTFLWPFVQQQAQTHNMLHYDVSGRPVINSCLITALSHEIYFWDDTTKEYIKCDKGNPTSAQYLTLLYSVHVPIIGDVTIWSTPKIDGAPKYSDEFDEEGQIQKDFLNKQIDKLSRKNI